MRLADLDLIIPVVTLLLGLGLGLGLELVARRCRPGSLGRELLRRARLSLTTSLVVGGLGWWLFDLLGRIGWPLPRSGREVRDLALTVGLMWTLLRCKSSLVSRIAGDPRWLPARSRPNRAFVLDLLDKLISAVVVLLGSLELLRQFGVAPALLLTASGIGAAALGLGAKTLLENLLGGVMLYVNRPFTVGDTIALPDRSLRGKVRAIGLHSTELITAERQPLFIPNALFAQHAIVNTSRPPLRRLELGLTLRPAQPSDLGRVIEALEALLRRQGEVLAEPAPQVQLVDYRGAGAELRLEAWCRNDPVVLDALRHRLLLELGPLLEGLGARLTPE
jgi:MscS family membrane protein